MGKKLKLTKLVRVFFLRMHCCTNSPTAIVVCSAQWFKKCLQQQRACNLSVMNSNIKSTNSKHLPVSVRTGSGYC